MVSIIRVLAAAAVAGGAGVSLASDCEQTSVGLTPLNDLGSGLYLDEFEGGLYPDGMNQAPPAHRAAGIAFSQDIVPRLPNGAPSPAGSYVLLSIGMSNTAQEFCSGPPNNCAEFSFVGQAMAHPAVNQDELVILNGAAGGQAASTWEFADQANYDRVRDDVLAPAGLSEQQVGAVWVKVANAGPQVGLPDARADAYALLASMGNIARAVRDRYPHVEVVFFSSRIYAGYADTALNPEPYAYESAFAVKWLVEAQIRQMAGLGEDPIAGDLSFAGSAPWIGWGAYLWADGLVPRSDGLTWACTDFAGDGTHPSMSGREKVGTLLLQFFLNSPFTVSWFRTNSPFPTPGDLNNDGVVDATDLALLLAAWGPCPGCPEDLNGNGIVGSGDLAMLLANWD